MFINTTDQDLELRFDLDRTARNAHVHILKAKDDPNNFDKLVYFHDHKPFGAKGTYRIASKGFDRVSMDEHGNIVVMTPQKQP